MQKQEQPEYVNSTDDVIRWVNVNNAKLHRLKRLPGFPKKAPHKGYHLPSIIEFIKQHDELNDSDSDKSARERKTEKECELLDIKIANAKNELIEVSKVDSLIARHAAQFKALLYSEFDVLPSQIQGLNIGECHTILERTAERICKEMQRVLNDDLINE